MTGTMKRILTIMAFAALATPAAADGLSSGYVCGPFPSAYNIDVEVNDDSPQMLKIREAAVRALKRDRTRITNSAELILAIDVRTLLEGTKRKKPDLGSVTDGSSDRIRARMNLWSNKRDSIVGGRKNTVIAEAVDEVRVEITVNDKSNGKCVWRGEALHSAGGADIWVVAEKITLHLIKLTGRNFRDKEFAIE